MYNPFSIENKKILVTGASSGIGKATAIECSRMGAKIVVTGRNEERLNDTFSKLEGDGHYKIIADLSNEEQMDALVEQLPDIQGLVNNAGIVDTCLTQFIKRDKLERIMEINTFAPILLIIPFSVNFLT